MFYRFPEIATEFDVKQQIGKIRLEADELFSELQFTPPNWDNIAGEVADVWQAAETCIRKAEIAHRTDAKSISMQMIHLNPICCLDSRIDALFDQVAILPSIYKSSPLGMSMISHLIRVCHYAEDVLKAIEDHHNIPVSMVIAETTAKNRRRNYYKEAVCQQK